MEVGGTGEPATITEAATIYTMMYKTEKISNLKKKYVHKNCCIISSTSVVPIAMPPFIKPPLMLWPLVSA